MNEPRSYRNVPALQGLDELAERASTLSSALAAIAEAATQLGRGLAGAEAGVAERDAAVTLARLDAATNEVSAWIGVLVLESPAVKRWQQVLLLQSLRTRGIHRDLTDLPSAGPASAGGRLAVAARRAGGDPSRVLAHISHWVTESFASVPSASDASLLAWTLEPEDLAWLDERCRGGPLEEVVRFASWLQAVEGNRDPGPALVNGLTRQWFECRSFRGPRRQLARRRGAAAGRRGACECEGWVTPAMEGAGRNPIGGQAALIVEWAVAAARAWPDRETLMRINDPDLRTRVERLRSSVAGGIGDAPDALVLFEWLDGSLRALTIPREASRTVHGHRAEVSARAPARST